MRKRIMALVLCCALLVGICGAFAEGDLQTEWDLTELYESADAWQADYDRMMELVPELGEYAGKLDNAQTIYDFFELYYDSELSHTLNKLYLYAYLGKMLDASDSVFGGMMAKIDAAISEMGVVTAYVDSEIYALPLETRQEIFADPILEKYAYGCEEYIDPEADCFSEETSSMLAVLSQAKGAAENVYSILTYVDLVYPTFTMPDGSEIILDDQAYANIVYDDSYDRDFKLKANEAILTVPKDLVNTYAALLNAEITENLAYAQVNGYETSREYFMEESDIDPAIFDMLIEAAHAGTEDYQRYLNLHKAALGVDELYAFDINNEISTFDPGIIKYDDAVAEVREALSILGEDYIEAYDTLTQNAYIDVYPAENKDTGACSLSMGDSELMPYILLNYFGYSSDVSTIAHEMGHSLYSYMYEKAQPAVYANPTTFTHEVTSITNELLYFDYKMANAESDDEKLFYLENIIKRFTGTFFSQVMFSEFEDYLNKTVEAGEMLDAETISDEFAGLYEQYRGDSVVFLPDARYQWTQVPHFYYDYYMYAYASSICYAAAISDRIFSGDEQALADYREMLSLGSSMSPADLLAVAGVDPLDDASYQYALDYFSRLVDEYAELTANY